MKRQNRIMGQLCIILVFMLIVIQFPIDAMGIGVRTSSGEQTSTENSQVATEAQNTAAPSTTTQAAKTAKQKIRVKRLKKVTGVKLTRYSTSTVKLTWNKRKNAKYYRIYYSKKKNGKYRCAGVTKKTHCLVKKLKNNTTYYFYVQTCKKKKETAADSKPSGKVHIKTKTFSRKTIFAGDSITEGIGYGKCFSQMRIGGRKKTVAYRGLNTITYHTQRVFNGKTGLQKLIAEKPYRIYMMLGLNEIHYRRSKDIIAEYKSLIRDLQKACPNTDIVLCAVSPVTKSERAKRTGFKQIPKFNQQLKQMAKETGTTYFDYTAFLKDSSGCLKSQYAAADGYHWQPGAYLKFAKVVEKFDKSLDE